MLCTPMDLSALLVRATCRVVPCALPTVTSPKSASIKERVSSVPDKTHPTLDEKSRASLVFLKKKRFVHVST